MIDPRLRVLRVVADRGTLSAAAADLGYTPSAVSHQLRTLARDVGARLLEPEGRNVRLTQAALTLLHRADELFARWEEIRGEVQQASVGGGLGRLRLAGFSTAASALLPPVAAASRVAFPQSVVQITEADPDVCFELLLADKVDVAVVVDTEALPASDDMRFEQHPLLTDMLDLLVPLGHPLADRERVRLVDAAGEEWIMDTPGGTYHRLAMNAFNAAGFTPTHAHRAVEWDTCVALVTAGLGVALVPRLARVPGGAEIVRVPLHGEDAPVRHVRTCVRRGAAGQPEIALALRELRRVAATLAEPDRPSYLQESLDV